MIAVTSEPTTSPRRRIDPVLLARAFRTVAIAEACSWTGLLVGMVFKYLVVFDDVGVKIFGPIHGVLFIVYVIITLVTARTFRWRAGTTIIGLLASIPPIDRNEERLLAIEGSVPPIFDLPPGCRFEPRCRYSRPVCATAVPDLVGCGASHRAACIRNTGYEFRRIAS